jgi:hypothetical protein
VIVRSFSASFELPRALARGQILNEATMLNGSAF